MIYLLPVLAVGQSGLHLQYMANAPAGQFYQPALLAEMKMESVRLSGDGSLWFNSSSVSIGTLQTATNYLTDDFKLRLVNDLESSDNKFQAGYHYSELLNFITGNIRWGISWRNRWGLNGEFDKPETMGLLLRGNAPYAGETIAEEGLFMRNVRYWEIGLSSAFDVGEKIKIGIRAKLLLGDQLRGIQELDYRFFTASDGSQIATEGNYDLVFKAANSTLLSQPGFGVDFGVIYDYSENWRLQASITDVGQMRWKADRYRGNFNLDYKGLDLVDLINTTDGSNAIFITDTLRTQLAPDSSREDFFHGLPTQINIGARRKVGTKGHFMLSTHLSPGDIALKADRILLNLTYHHQFAPWLMLGVNAYGGGPDRFGAGAVGMVQIIHGDELFISIFGSVDNALSFLIPQQGQGSGVNIGASMGF